LGPGNCENRVFGGFWGFWGFWGVSVWCVWWYTVLCMLCMVYVCCMYGVCVCCMYVVCMFWLSSQDISNSRLRDSASDTRSTCSLVTHPAPRIDYNESPAEITDSLLQLPFFSPDMRFPRSRHVLSASFVMRQPSPPVIARTSDCARPWPLARAPGGGSPDPLVKPVWAVWGPGGSRGVFRL